MSENRKSRAEEAFPAIAVALLLLMTAWGNAMAMLIVSGLGLVVGLLIYGKALFKGSARVALVAMIVAAAIAIALTCGCIG